MIRAFDPLFPALSQRLRANRTRRATENNANLAPSRPVATTKPTHPRWDAPAHWVYADKD
jgi:hypothetical protein